MIRRDAGDHWLLISQVDHAYLAADLAAAWGNAQVPTLPHRDLLIAAIRDHDDGWRCWEKSPQVDPERGWPRDFFEMPMTQATEIWSHSIEAAYERQREASAVLAQFEQFLATRSKRLTADRSLIAIAALSMRSEFDADRLMEQLADKSAEKSLSRSTVYRTLGWLEGAGLLQKNARIRDRNIYAAPERQIGPSALAGLWVSLHFTTLGQRAREARHEADEDREALDRFLAGQDSRQSEWRAALAVSSNGDPSNDPVEVGLRWLQFFDRLSLWLCCASRAQTELFRRPCEGTIHFTPLPSGEIAVEPYPFALDEMSVSVPVRLVSVGRYTDAEFQAVHRTAPIEQLHWTFVRW